MSNNRSEKRPLKGNTIIAFPADYVVIDLETTGFCSDYDEIIEFAGIKVSNNEVVDTFTTLIKPRNRIYEDITELTGITNEMVVDAPKIKDVLPKIREFIGDSIIIGHNVNFDVNFLYDDCIYYECKPLTNDFVDTIRFSHKINPELEHHRLVDVVEHYSIDADRLHRAMADCSVTHKCYLLMKNVAIEKYGSEKAFCDAFKYNYNSKLKDIATSKTEFDETHPLYKKVCVFTGTLEKMQRKDAMQIVLDFGGECGTGVTAKTNYLILGNNDYCSQIKDGKSNKQKRAEELKKKGKDIEIIPENVFYDMIEDVIV